jgi:hypothetical protein
LAKGKTWFVPSVVVRPEAVVEAFVRAVDDPVASADADEPASTQALWDSLLLETAVHTNELPPSDHYNLIVVALDYMVRQPNGFASEDAMFLLYGMLRHLPDLETFDPAFRHRGAAALSLLLYRDVGLIRLDAEIHFTIVYLLARHCRAATKDLPSVANNFGRKIAIGDKVTGMSLDNRWRHWFSHDKLDGETFDRLMSDMRVWRDRLIDDNGNSGAVGEQA